MSNPWQRKEVIGDCGRKRLDASVAIYALCEGEEDRPRYIGKTVQYLHERHKAHIRTARRGCSRPVSRWIRKQHRLGRWLTIKLLEYVPAGCDWAARERHWISVIRPEQPDCLNICDGGEGLAGHRFSNEHRARISKALSVKRVVLRCSQCGSMVERKPSAVRENTFCGRSCYQRWQRGKPKRTPRHG